MRRRQHHAPDRMTRTHNRVMALSKIDMAPIDKLDERMLVSIANTHKVPLAELQERLDQRKAREWLR